MVNYDAGKAMGDGRASVWWTSSARADKWMPSKAEALMALDVICDPWRNSDAEFEAAVDAEYGYYTDPQAPLGMLIAIAFDATREQIARFAEGDADPWFDEVYMKFRERYGFA